MRVKVFDNGQTCEPCPRGCGYRLEWRDRPRGRVLECPCSRCAQPALSVGARVNREFEKEWPFYFDTRTIE